MSDYTVLNLLGMAGGALFILAVYAWAVLGSRREAAKDQADALERSLRLFKASGIPPERIHPPLGTHGLDVRGGRGGAS